MNYVIAYDIKDNKRRTKVSDILQMYGYRVNYSVFELDITKKELDTIKNLIKSQKLITKEDSIRFYHLCKNCIDKSFVLSKEKGIFEYNYNIV